VQFLATGLSSPPKFLDRASPTVRLVLYPQFIIGYSLVYAAVPAVRLLLFTLHWLLVNLNTFVHLSLL